MRSRLCPRHVWVTRPVTLQLPSFKGANSVERRLVVGETERRFVERNRARRKNLLAQWETEKENREINR